MLQQFLTQRCLIGLESPLRVYASEGCFLAFPSAEPHLDSNIGKVLYRVGVAPTEIEYRYQYPLSQVNCLADYERGGLDQRTRVFLVCIIILATQANSARVEYVICILKHCGVPMEKLDRETTIGVAQLDGLLHDLVGGLTGKDNPGVERVEESDDERSQVVYQQRSGDSHRRSSAGILLVFPKEQLFSLIEERLSLGMAGHGIVLIAAAAVVTGFCARHLHAGDSAVVVAPLAHERSKLTLAIHNLLKAMKLRLLAGYSLFG